VTTPVLTVADPTLSVRGRGGTVGLGTNVSTTDTNDRVTVNIRGLPKSQTITSALDGQTFRGNNITLTAAQVDSGPTLNSYSRWGRSDATLTLTANAKDPVTGAVASTAPQTITVTGLRSAATTSQPTSVTNPVPATSTTTAAAAPQPTSTRTLSAAVSTVMASPATQGFALSNQFRGLVAGGATSAPAATAVTNDARSTGTTTASLASQSYALLNQYLAGSTGRGDAGQIVASVSNGATAGQVSLLTRPQH
jgi:hypothetical protein